MERSQGNGADGVAMVRVAGLRREFPRAGGTITAVDDVTFDVRSGEVYGLLGPNGAGKTTTLRMILGLLEPTAGLAEVGGLRTDRSPQEVKAQIGLVSAGAGLYQWLTSRELLEFFGDLFGCPPPLVAQRIERLADLFELWPFLDQRCATLSTGQKQRVNLARALIHDPPVMLLDEPTRGLDVIGSKVIFDYVKHLRSRGKAVIVCTHRLDEAQRLCDRFGLLHQGRLVLEGTLDQLREATGCETLTDMFLSLLVPKPRRSEPTP